MSEHAYSHCIKLDNFRQTQILDSFAVNPASLEDGQVMVRIDKVALTANSVSYVIGSQQGMMPWLDLFPAPEGLGHIPCWGFGEVLYSRDPDVPEGERLYGFFPIASHVVLTPGKVHDRGFTDTASTRAGVAPFYNEYSYIRKEAGYNPDFEDSMMLFRPLFGTSYLLESFCEDRGYFEQANQVIISSASSKTAMGFGYLLRKNHGEQVRAIGLTSPRNKDFVTSLDCYDEVITYDKLDAIKGDITSVFFDIAGNREVVAGVHNRLGDHIAYSGHVGQTHWDDKDKENVPLPGPTPVSWSGPDQVMLLRERHGEQGFMKLVQGSMVEFMMAAFNWITMVRSEGPIEVDERVKSMLDGEIRANEGIILSP